MQNNVTPFYIVIQLNSLIYMTFKLIGKRVKYVYLYSDN